MAKPKQAETESVIVVKGNILEQVIYCSTKDLEWTAIDSLAIGEDIELTIPKNMVAKLLGQVNMTNKLKAALMGDDEHFGILKRVFQTVAGSQDKRLAIRADNGEITSIGLEGSPILLNREVKEKVLPAFNVEYSKVYLYEDPYSSTAIFIDKGTKHKAFEKTWHPAIVLCWSSSGEHGPYIYSALSPTVETQFFALVCQKEGTCLELGVDEFMAEDILMKSKDIMAYARNLLKVVDVDFKLSVREYESLMTHVINKGETPQEQAILARLADIYAAHQITDNKRPKNWLASADSGTNFLDMLGTMLDFGSNFPVEYHSAPIYDIFDLLLSDSRDLDNKPDNMAAANALSQLSWT